MATKVDRRPLLAYLRVQRATDREVLAALRSASARIDEELARLATRPGIGAQVRVDQLRLSQHEIRLRIVALYVQLGDIVQAGKVSAAEAAVDLMVPKALKAVVSAADFDYLLRSAKAQAVRSITHAESRLKLSKRPLSERVYHSRVLATGQVDKVINDALLRGASARDLARDVRSFVNPSTPGGLRYASMRLARTELNNAFHATSVLEGVRDPWVTGQLWNLSGSHPKPDECNDYADQVFAPAEVPAKPHPNCLCYTTPETPSREAFIDAFMAGDYDSRLADLGL